MRRAMTLTAAFVLTLYAAAILAFETGALY